MKTPIQKLMQLAREQSLDLIYVDDPSLVGYFTGFESDPHERLLALFILHDKSFLFTPSLDESDARNASIVEDVISYKDEEDPWEIINKKLETYNQPLKQIGIIENSLTVDRYKKMIRILDEPKTTDISGLIQSIQLIKTPDEINKMIYAGNMADKALEIGISALKIGISEQEVVAEIEYELKKLGISEMSFQTMVLFGDHAGSPHGNPGSRTLKENEFVLFDLGVVADGYTSDVTRTIAFGEIPSDSVSIYEIVLEAQEKAQASVKPGITTGELDAIARDIIEEAGYGQYFTHRLGHGLGKTVHEFPSISKNSNLTLEKGMCFSLEPGIYIENVIGIRIEDCVYVTDDGCIPFTNMTKKMLNVLE